MLTNSNLSSILVGGRSGALPSHSVLSKIVPSIDSLSTNSFSDSFFIFSFNKFFSSSFLFSSLFIFFSSLLISPSFPFPFSFSFSFSDFFPNSISSYNEAEDVTVLLNIPGGSASNLFSKFLLIYSSISNLVGLVYKFTINLLFISTS